MNSITQKPWDKWLLTILLLVVFSSASRGQTEPIFTATINTEFLIEIVTASPEVQSSYLVDISGLGFAAEQDAQAKFNLLTDNAISFNLNWEARTVAIMLRIDDSNASWTTTDWNKYFLEKSKW